MHTAEKSNIFTAVLYFGILYCYVNSKIRCIVTLWHHGQVIHLLGAILIHLDDDQPYQGCCEVQGYHSMLWCTSTARVYFTSRLIQCRLVSAH